MSETKIMLDIKAAFNSFCSGCEVFRNNIGRFKNISFGLKTGSGDLIGWTRVRVAPDMVGKVIAVFLSVEVKDTGEKIIKDSAQDNWRTDVNEAGGIAFEADSVDEAWSQLQEHLKKYKK